MTMAWSRRPQGPDLPGATACRPAPARPFWPSLPARPDRWSPSPCRSWRPARTISAAWRRAPAPWVVIRRAWHRQPGARTSPGRSSRPRQLLDWPCGPVRTSLPASCILEFGSSARGIIRSSIRSSPASRRKPNSGISLLCKEPGHAPRPPFRKRPSLLGHRKILYQY